MKQKIHHILLASIAVILAGCVEDTGHYDYVPAAEVTPGTISGINESYSVLALNTLEINPTIAGDEPSDYTWYAYPVPTFHGSPTYTLGNEKALNAMIALPTGQYRLVLEVKNQKHLTSTYAYSTLHVTREFSRGWFIAKQIGDETDIDFIRLETNTLYPNILQTINGKRPAGKPLDNAYTSTYYCYEVENPDGTTTLKTDQPAFFVATDSDLHVYHASEMNLLKEFDNAFFEAPARAPEALFLAPNGMFVLNDGKLHGIWNGFYNVGKFGYQVQATNVKLAPMTARVGSGFLFFDSRASSYLYLYTGGTSLDELYPYTHASSNMNVDLIYLREQEQMGGQLAAYALVKDRSTGKFRVQKLASWLVSSMMSPITNEYPVPDASELTTATVFGLHNCNDALYYSRGDNKVGYYSITSGQANPGIITFPADERVAYIRHVYNDNMDFECLAVLTNSDNGWKLYCYNFVGYTSDVQLPAFHSFSGEGIARSLLYRDVQITATN
ncbi:MAG: hypothetical protein LBP56_10535 [Odoribacteraceae bacterium]|jgi:hypothetical protein|nr:hypothetical protein [Odoribacteraceae bacterium]